MNIELSKNEREIIFTALLKHHSTINKAVNAVIKQSTKENGDEIISRLKKERKTSEKLLRKFEK